MVLHPHSIGSIYQLSSALRRREPERILYLAIPLTTYKTFFQLDFSQEIVEESQVKMIVYDVECEIHSLCRMF
jgi:hypothetical protein